jgi:hypothetical protein
MSATENRSTLEPDANEDRRKFIAACGKFALVTPPAITMLLSTSLNSTAIAQSGNGNSDEKGKNKGGNGDNGGNGNNNGNNGGNGNGNGND